MKVIFDLPDGLTERDIPDLKAAIQDWAAKRVNAQSAAVPPLDIRAARAAALRHVKYPNLRRASANMGYNFTYLYRVLEGQPGFKGREGLREDFWAESQRISAERESKRMAR